MDGVADVPPVEPHDSIDGEAAAPLADAGADLDPEPESTVVAEAEGLTASDSRKPHTGSADSAAEPHAMRVDEGCGAGGPNGPSTCATEADDSGALD